MGRCALRQAISNCLETQEMTHMSSNPSSHQTSTTSGHRETEEAERIGLSELRQDMASLKTTISRFASQAGDDAAKTVRGAGQTLAAQVGSAAGGVADMSSDLATSAKEHAKTFASELEGMARRNPLGTIAGALAVGVVLGMMSRGRT
jgi:ElaB/YqjD/DUF883 family membrane-anchored ribosome-binding protein